jgi:tetratricopeptide (TPR) repeat protein
MVLLEDASRVWWQYFTLAGIGWTAQALGNYERANASFQEAMAWSRERDDLEFVQFMFWCLGALSFEQSHYEQALNYFQESASLARTFKNKFMLARIIRGMGELNIFLGRYTQAKTLLEESFTIQRGLGNPWDPAWTFRLLGRAACLQGDYEQAWIHYSESLRLAQTYDSRHRLAWCLVDLAELALLTNQPKKAATLLGTAEAVPELYQGLYPHGRLELDELLKTIRDQLDVTFYSSDYEVGKRMSLEEAAGYALKEL